MKARPTSSAAIAAAIFLAASAAAAGDGVVGRFQPPGSIARASLPLGGQVRIRVPAPEAVDVSGAAADGLALEMEIRVARHDRATGRDALRYVRNGQLFVYDSDGVEVYRGDSPVQRAVPPAFRAAAAWMPAIFPLGSMKPTGRPLAAFELREYNDNAKEGIRTGVSYEIRNARIVRRDASPEASAKAAEAKRFSTFCNPIDIEYMIQRGKRQKDGRVTDVFCESADPALVVFNGEYWLFASHGEGYWHSKDMGRWKFVRVDVTKPVLSAFRSYAPATCVVGDTLYVTHSGKCPILKTKNPLDTNAWEIAVEPNGWSDPGMFYDDPATGGDGYVYLYKGLSHYEPIKALRLDPGNGMKPVGDGFFDCAWPDQLNRGFEVPGDFNEQYGAKDTQEGAWPFKRGGKYYLTCAVPGTQFASYCDNCYVADSPIGPFRYCENSPVVWKSTGYVQGAGHGCVTKDMKGRWWKVDTCRMTGFNRRLVVLPSMFDENGDFYTNAAMGDRPMYVPGDAKDPFGEPGPGWALLSYGKLAAASSNAGGAEAAFDENMGTAWIPATDDPGEWLAVDLGRVCAVRSIQVNFSDIEPKAGGRDNDWAYRYILEFSQDGRDWRVLADRSKAKASRPHEYIEFEGKVGARFIRWTNRGSVPGGAKLAVNGIRVFGECGGAKPDAVDAASVKVVRDAKDGRRARVSWSAANGAQGYVIRHGIAPDKLYTHDQVFGETEFTVRSLNRWVDYWFAVDAFGEGGVAAARGKPVRVPATQRRVEGYDMVGDSPSPAIVNRAAGAAVCEAERAAFSGGGVRPEYEVRASGATALWGMGAKGTRVEFVNVAAGMRGAAVLRVSYATPFAAKIGISVNGGKAFAATLPATSGWPTYATTDIPVSGVRKGADNTVRIGGLGDRFHLDYIQLLPQAAAGLKGNGR